MEIEIVPATLDHARAIRLRPGDAREIAAMGLTPIAAFEQSMSRSLWAQAYVIDGEVAALVGLAINSILGGVGAPWLLTGRPVDRHRKLFLQETRRGVARMRAEFSRLGRDTNCVTLQSPGGWPSPGNMLLLTGLLQSRAWLTPSQHR